MQAIQAMRFGGPDVLVMNELPDPVPGPGEVVVGVSVATSRWSRRTCRAGAGRAL